MSVPSEIEKTIQEMVNRIVRHFNPEKVVLFGSHARGTAKADSDVDLLVVMPVPQSKRELRLKIRTHLHGLHVSKDVLVATPQEYEEYRDIPGTVVRAAHLEGKILYDRAA